jgi:pimeloyl-ACP methyl ester carboxylesterase
MGPQPGRFAVHIPDGPLDDLQKRLVRTRWPADLRPGWERGADVEYLRDLVQYWRSHFDWRAQEQRINRLPQYTVEKQGDTVHFVHVRGRGPAPLPLLLSHGWPSSFLEFFPLIPLLIDPEAHGGDPADAFDVVVPSLPGFGFTSGPPGRRGIRDAPALLVWLMTEVLGYPRFCAHGTDIGAFVTNRLGLDHTASLFGGHVTLLAEPRIDPEAAPLTDEERRYLAQRAHGHERSQAYAHLQRTTPTTLAYGLEDSPVGLAAWIVEKWRNWSDCGGDVEQRFSKDQLLTTVMLYWLTRTATSSIQTYADLALASAAVPGHEQLYPDAPPGADANPLPPGRRIDAPFGLLRTAEYDPPRAWADRAYSDMRGWSRADRGGHFLAMEEPDLLASDLRRFFRPFRQRR